MKITFVSDLHLEHDREFTIANPGSDVLVLAGDICVSQYLNRGDDSPYALVRDKFSAFIEDCSRNWSHVIYLAGNHEYYHGYIDEEMIRLKDYFRHIPNLYILDDESLEIDGVLFVGSTLWFDGNRGNPVTIQTLNRGMNDFRIIQWKTRNYIKFKPQDAIIKHAAALDYITKTIDGYEGKIVLCTHHSPSFLGVHPKYADDIHMNGGYHSDLSELILDNNINLWIHGHTHVSLDYMLGNTNIVCNPKGYHNENPDFNPSLVVEV